MSPRQPGAAAGRDALGIEPKARASELAESVLRWTPWVPLEGCWRGSTVPAEPGLYRIRRVAWDGLDYVGQTGRALRHRLGMLRGIYGSEMPYRAPHTVGPALWALRQSTGCEFEFSVCPIEGADPWRKGWEVVAIAMYRQRHGQSPTFNFGRMPEGFRMSSDNNARLVAAGKRFRGGPAEHAEVSHRPGVPPMGSLMGNPEAADWGGHDWSDWLALPRGCRVLAAREIGLYRIRGRPEAGLLYIGEGVIRSRLTQHLAKIDRAAHRQGVVFGGAALLSASWTLNAVWLDHQRLELENDLIAAHVLETGQGPPAQFLGEGRDTEAE